PVARHGFHVSPGLLEGMFAIGRSFTPRAELGVDRTSLGHALLSRGVDLAALAGLARNPLVSSDDGEVPVFELTEEIDRAAVVAVVERALEDAHSPNRQVWLTDAAA